MACATRAASSIGRTFPSSRDIERVAGLETRAMAYFAFLMQISSFRGVY